MGDKEAKFVGSRQWIGSTEVSYVLDHLFGVRILHTMAVCYLFKPAINLQFPI